MIKQDFVLKIRSVEGSETQDIDLPMTQLVPWLRAAVDARDREHKEVTHTRSRLHRQHSHHAAAVDTIINHEQPVQFLFGQAKSKKANRQNILEQAQIRAAAEVKTFLAGPIAAVETTDKAMEMLRATKLSEIDSWRDVSQKVPMAESRYIMDIYDCMKEFAVNKVEGAPGHAFIYNFRTGNCVYYDLCS